MNRIGISTCGFPLTEEYFAALAETEIEAIEISMWSSQYPFIDYKNLNMLAKRYGIELWSYHLPFAPFHEIFPGSRDASVRKKTVDYLSELMKKASDIGIDKFVMHSGGEGILPEERQELMENTMETFDKMAEIAHELGGMIAVEDLPRSCLGNTTEEVLQLVSVNDKLKVCFDTNHLLQDDNNDFLRAVKDRLLTVHISDYDFVDEKHWLPGEGDIDWPTLMNTFKEVGYQGVFMYELELKTPDSIMRPRDLTFGDIVENAKTLFNGKTPMALGKRK